MKREKERPVKNISNSRHCTYWIQREMNDVILGLVKKLAEISSNSNLNERFLPRIFARLVNSCNLWESYSIDFKIFLVLLSEYWGMDFMIPSFLDIWFLYNFRVPDDVFKYMEIELLDLLEIVLGAKADREMTFRTLQRFGKLFEKDEFDFANYAETVEKIILGL